MTTSTSAHLRELGAFLKAARARVTPEQIGLRPGLRRRTPGLRREEVAALAGISATWYTWIEQGRDVACSTATLNRVARALRMTAIERRHAFDLAGRTPLAAKPKLSTAVDTSLRELADGLTPHPAYFINGRWDVLYCNRASAAVFGAFDPQSTTRSNVLVRLFLDLELRQRFDDWESTAESAVAQFRAATAKYVSHETFTAFLARLADASPEFRTLWMKRQLAPLPIKDKTFRHSHAGVLSFHYATLRPDSAPDDVRLVMYLPQPASRSSVTRLVDAYEASPSKRPATRRR